MKTEIIATIQGCPITLITADDGSEVVEFTADADIDCDGLGGNPFRDPYFQADTKLHNEGKALYAERENYVVVPPVVVEKTKGIVFGSRVTCLNESNGKKAVGVVGDEGPRSKIGELSVAFAEALGLDGNPNHGGTDRKIIQYRIEVGVPADGYSLQKS